MAAHSQPLFVSGKILQNFLKLRKQHLAPPQAQKIGIRSVPVLL